MALFANSGSVFLAQAIKAYADTLYVALGRGDSAWDSSPVDPTIYDTALEDEVGRRKAAQVAYCSPDEGGAIQTDLGSFSVSVSATKYLYVLGQFNRNDIVGEELREVGLFGGVTLANGVSDSGFILPAQLANAGTLISPQRFSVFTRSNEVNENFQFVLEL